MPTPALKRFAAEVIFPDPATLADATVALAKLGLDCKRDPDARDPAGTDYVWAMVSGSTELAEDAIADWLAPLVRPFGGDIVEWRYGEPWKVRD
jgi:hypothetical protein